MKILDVDRFSVYLDTLDSTNSIGFYPVYHTYLGKWMGIKSAQDGARIMKWCQ